MIKALRAILTDAAPEIVKAIAAAIERRETQRHAERIARYAAIERAVS